MSAEHSSTALVYHPLCLEHNNPAGHPERPERLTATLKLLDENKMMPRLHLTMPKEASEETIARIHHEHYIEAVKETAKAGGGYIDADTYISRDSYRAARLAAGAVVAAIDRFADAGLTNAFCLVRPPGHHATADTGMGFCLFNNLAIGVEYAKSKYGVGNILIVDWDAHHGNGLQDIFYARSDVLYISLHQSPHYPGTGHLDEIGIEEGEGYTINIPLPAGSGDAVFNQAFGRIIAPVATQFKPQFIMLAAGYDGHFADPLASLNLTTQGYARMSEEIVSLASSIGCMVIASLEGGYDLTALSHSVLATLSRMANIEADLADPFEAPARPSTREQVSQTDRLFDQISENLSSYWEL